MGPGRASRRVLRSNPAISRPLRRRSGRCRRTAPVSGARSTTKPVARGVAWLEIGWLPVTVEDRSFQILGLVWGGGYSRVIRSAAQSLLALQEADGGWAQRAGSGTEAYSTGQALVALRNAGAVAVGTAEFQRGIQYLRNSQLADGSWYVASRAAPFNRTSTAISRMGGISSSPPQLRTGLTGACLGFALAP